MYNEKTKLLISARYEELELIIPEIRDMKDFDQRSDHHDLTLDKHTLEHLRQLSREKYIAHHPKKDLILLAAKFHDIGKLSPDGQQVHPKNPKLRQYIGHEAESESMIRNILPRYFDVSDEEVEFVARLAGLHASAQNLVRNFSKTKTPKGRELSAYDDFFARAEEVPGDLNDNMRIIFAMNKADKMAGFNPKSNQADPKVMKIVEHAEEAVKTLQELERALPALMIAVYARRNGDQKSQIVFEESAYRYIPPKERIQEKYVSRKKEGRKKSVLSFILMEGLKKSVCVVEREE